MLPLPWATLFWKRSASLTGNLRRSNTVVPALTLLRPWHCAQVRWYCVRPCSICSGRKRAPLPNVPTAATRVASASAAAGNANANANTSAPTGPSSGLNSDLSSGPNAPRAPPCDRR